MIEILLPAIVLIGLLIFVHELGHYAVGRACGIGVEIFSIGFGPPIVAFKRQDTTYQICWIPLGGFVKFYGMFPFEEIPEHLHSKPFFEAKLWQRFLTVLAGPAANLVLPLLIYIVLALSGIPQTPAIIGEVQKNSVAAQAGLRFGDQILAINDKKINDWSDLQDIIAESADKPLTLTIKRNDKTFELQITPESKEIPLRSGKTKKIGRLGIAAAALSPIIHITDPKGFASKQGLRTGDQIEALEVNGQRQTISFWPEFLSLLEHAAHQGHDMTLYVRNQLNSTDTTAKNELRKIELPLSQLIVGYKKPLNAHEILMLLGMRDAQLTVGFIDDELKKQYHLQPGDRLIQWDNKPINDIYDLIEASSFYSKEAVVLTIERQGQIINVTAQLSKFVDQLPEGRSVRYGLDLTNPQRFAFLATGKLPHPQIKTFSTSEALSYAFVQTTKQAMFLTSELTKLITGQVPLKALGGPMLIAKVASDAAKVGWQTYLLTMGFISVNLAVINLFPIPALDGGQIVMMGVELIRRKKPSPEMVEHFQRIGFVLIMVLVILATYNDLSRFWASMLESLKDMF